MSFDFLKSISIRNFLMTKFYFYSGSNATITHGAGINNPNLNDIVLEIEFVNAIGELQVT